MVKDKILNQYARHNISVLDPITVSLLKSGDWRDTPSGLLRCVKCGRHGVSTPIIVFFNYQGEKILCYGCQKIINNKLYEQSINSSSRKTSVSN
ncbi:MAG: hypothetical protein WC526_02295 [Patescibacteria group bacterium]